jgi:hypothetical protein
MTGFCDVVTIFCGDSLPEQYSTEPEGICLECTRPFFNNEDRECPSCGGARLEFFPTEGQIVTREGALMGFKER